MSSEAQSNDSSHLASASSTKRVRISSRSTSAPTQSTNTSATSTKTPLGAARVLRDAYVATLHKCYQPFLSDLTDDVLKYHSSFFYKHVKFREMCLDPNHVATSVINDVKLTLQPCEEIEKSEDYKALHSQKVEEVEATRRAWTEKYTSVVLDMNRKAYLRRFRY